MDLDRCGRNHERRSAPGRDARVLPEITYAEAAELAYNGAKALHPRTLAPLAERGIPVWSKNSFAPEKPGTRILPSVDAGHGPHAVTSMTDVALVSMEPASAAVSGTKLMARAADALARANVEILAFTSSSTGRASAFWSASRSSSARGSSWKKTWRWSWSTVISSRSKWTPTSP